VTIYNKTSCDTALRRHDIEAITAYKIATRRLQIKSN